MWSTLKSRSCLTKRLILIHVGETRGNRLVLVVTGEIPDPDGPADLAYIYIAAYS